ncbi:RWD-domain-containing protein [Gorgonomyces haynaldii]|nr:RWD-domain-containing protein [Gorgonomyces haynaldii]
MQEEIEQEIETLGYIYTPEELEIEGNVVKITFQVPEHELEFQLVFTLHEEYPRELPQLEIHGLEEEDAQVLMEEARNVGNESLGMAMIFNIASALKDKIDQVITDRLQREEEEREREKERLELEEQKRFEGSKVTRDTFLAWQKSFIQEAYDLQKKGQPLIQSQLAALAVDQMGKHKGDKLTGRQLFEKDTSLAKTDMQYVDEGEVVQVDASLFENLDDLDDDNHVLDHLTED